MEHFLGFNVLYSAEESANYLNNEKKTQKDNSSTIIVFFQSINANATHLHTPVKFSKFYKHFIHFFHILATKPLKTSSFKSQNTWLLPLITLFSRRIL